MKSFRIEIPKELEVDSIVNVYIDNELFVHIVHQQGYSKKYYMFCGNGNGIIFVRLGINKNSFHESFIWYRTRRCLARSRYFR